MLCDADRTSQTRFHQSASLQIASEPMGSAEVPLSRPHRTLTPLLNRVRGEDQLEQQILSPKITTTTTTTKGPGLSCADDEFHRRPDCDHRNYDTPDSPGLSATWKYEPTTHYVFPTPSAVLEPRSPAMAPPEDAVLGRRGEERDSALYPSFPHFHGDANEISKEDSWRQVRDSSDRELTAFALSCSGACVCSWRLRKDRSLSPSATSLRLGSFSTPDDVPTRRRKRRHVRRNSSRHFLLLMTIVALTSSSLLPLSRGFDLFSRQRAGKRKGERN